MVASVRYAWVDYARLLSAFGVVIFHYCSKGIDEAQAGLGVARFPILSAIADYGYLGVNFFFIISGFVIFFSALGRTPGQFAAARVVRLYPAFLFCMTLTVLVVMGLGAPISAVQYLGNLTMVPAVIGVIPVDGVYWTLVPEILFYAMIFIAMAARALKYPRALVAVAVLVTSASVFSGIMVPYFDGFAPLFPAGCALALFYRNPRDRLVLGLFMIAAVTSVTSTYQFAENLRMERVPALSPTIAAAIVAAMFAAFLWFRTRDVKNGERAKAFGALTYPLYLLHSAIGFAILSLVQTEANKWVVTPLVVGFIALLAWAVAVQVEARYKVTWRLLADRIINRPITTILRFRGYRLRSS